jgi:hypothetical protein
MGAWTAICSAILGSPALLRTTGTVLAAAAIMATISAGGGAVGSTSSARLYLSPQGSDARDCTQSDPCASFDRAYHAAAPGTIVVVAGGLYPPQTITPDHSKDAATSDVVFEPAQGANVRIADELRLEGTHIEVRDLSAPDWYAAPTAGYLVLRDLDVDAFYVTGASDVSVLGGDVGPYENGASEVKSCAGCTSPPHDIVVDGVRFHDYTRTNETHVECLHVYPVDGMIVRNSRFERCAIIDLGFFQYGPAGASHNLLIENNFFDAPTSGGSYSLDITASLKLPITNVLIRNNSSLATMLVDTSGEIRQVRFVGNIGPRTPYHCYSGVSFVNNVWDGARCGPTDVNASPGFVDPSRGDLHLLPNSAAIGRGALDDHPAVDIDGQLRPDRVAPDAGADQREPALIVAARSIGSVTLGMSRQLVVAHYGRPRSEQSWPVAGATIATYPAPGGALSVIYTNGTVVGTQTTSIYYRTAAGAGPGRTNRGADAPWIVCRRAYQRTHAHVDTLYTPVGGRPAAPLRRVTIVRHAFDPPC